MAAVRNISEHTVDLRALGRSVAPEEQVDVPKDIYDAHVWPETVWESVRTSSKKGD